MSSPETNGAMLFTEEEEGSFLEALREWYDGPKGQIYWEAELEEAKLSLEAYGEDSSNITIGSFIL